ncbi:MAG: SDR family NAD(P)-dependent oxidoreductase [Flavobacteriaceae bacterium]
MLALPLQDKIVLVTGAGSGLGRATALLAAAQGARLLLADIDEAGGNETQRRVSETGAEAQFVRADVSMAEDAKAMVASCIQIFGRLDCAVNNAGVLGAKAPIAEYDIDEWHRIIAINLTGVFLSMRYEIPAMLQGGSGSIVNIGSTASLGGRPEMAAYAATKHAVVGLTRSAAMEYGPRNIRVNCIMPGSFATPMSASALEGEGAEKMMQNTPLRRIAAADEIAQSIVWLCSEAASFVTGASLSVDGGKRAG